MFTKSGLLLNNELYLVNSCICNGLTTMRGSHLGDRGTYYAAFFHLSNGLERLMKVTHIIDHMAKHNLAAPTRQELSGFGHDLVSLFDHLRTLSLPKQLANPVAAVNNQSVAYEILAFLSAFAETSGRYFNINQLTPQPPGGDDPLARWKTILDRIWIEDVASITKRRLDALAQPFATHRASALITILGHDLDGTALTTKTSAELGPRYFACGSYAVRHIIAGLLLPLRELLDVVATPVTYVKGTKGMAVPDMGEFLGFVYMDRSSTLRKRRWP
jgi:hypothetical protein